MGRISVSETIWFDTIIALILRASRYGVIKLVIVDPRRRTFEKMGDYFLVDGGGKVINRDISLPYNILGRILTVTA